MIQRLINWQRAASQRRELKRLVRHCRPDDLPSLALKIAVQRSLGTAIGKRCRLLGGIDAVNPHLVKIGDKCVIGGESRLLAHGPGFDGKELTVIGDYTYLGYRVTVLPGVKIGEGCIIGAGAIVTRDIPDGSVAVGNPARVLRQVSPEEAADIRYRLDNDLFFGRDGKIT
ncbi:DapH/DapD/GlmU-related protein [Parvularcula sp. IMCC14364]|uniref:acyltransferase n=1 Tax=Parvularcula sp. IMCC14364 TaxID=3067902 RepID=UPI002740517E|nr:acyltransferase [Parvularcula sp. IMCC14364]